MNTNSKAAILARIKNLQTRLHSMRMEYDTSASKARGAVLFQGVTQVDDALAQLHAEIAATVKEETSLPFQFNEQTFKATMELARKQILQRFSGFPMAAALAEMVILFLESEMRMTTHFRALHKEAMADDRMRGNPDFYGVDGEPNAKVRGEKRA